jgi:hypothetical protein
MIPVSERSGEFLLNTQAALLIGCLSKVATADVLPTIGCAPAKFEATSL